MKRLEQGFVVAGLLIVGLQYAVVGPWLGIAKGLAMLPLAALAYHATRAVPRPTSARPVLLGVLASLAGDVAIELSFVAGLFCFLLAHLCYLASMGLPRGFPKGNLLLLLPAAAYLGAVLGLIEPKVPPDMLGPVLGYIVVIMALLGRATLRASLPAAGQAEKTLAQGIWLFALSDSLIAMNRWFHPIPLAGVWIMLFYYAGQLLIVRSTFRPTSSHADEQLTAE